MLNSESRDTAPAFFVDENEALVDYASFDGCFQGEEGRGDDGEAQKVEEANTMEDDEEEKRQLGTELEEALAMGTAKGGGGGEGSTTVAMLGQKKVKNLDNF